MNTEILKKILFYIHEYIYEKISLLELAEVAGYSPFYFSKLFAETSFMRLKQQKPHGVSVFIKDNIIPACMNGLH